MKIVFCNSVGCVRISQIEFKYSLNAKKYFHLYKNLILKIKKLYYTF